MSPFSAVPRPVPPRRAALAAAAATALVVALPGQAAAAPGDLDPAFGDAGRLVSDLGGYEQATAVAVQPDGRIVAVGGIDRNGGDFALARYLPDGSPDPAFGDGGRVFTDIDGGGDTANGVALQPDGAIVVVGTSESTSLGGFYLTVARYLPDGTPDLGFGGTGHVVTDFGTGGADDGTSVAIQQDGLIVVAGQSAGDFALARYRPDGILDTTFGTGGRVTTDFAGGADAARSVAVRTDGRIVAAGHHGAGPAYDFAVARYNPDGGLDTTFSGDGRATVDFGAVDMGHAVAVHTDGRVVVAGGSGNDFAVARLLADGSPDPAFSGDGRTTTDFDGGSELARAVVIQPDGRIVAAGRRGGDFALARYQTDGSLDTGFSGDGRTVTDFAGGFEEAYGVALQGDGRIVAAGYRDGDFALARYEGGGGAPLPTGVDLRVTKTGPPSAVLGTRLTYTITVTNTGTSASATGVTLTDAHTGPGTLVSAAPGQGSCSVASGTAGCALGTIAPGAAVTVSVVVEPTAVGTLRDTATVSAAQSDPVTSNNTATATTTVTNSRGCTVVGTSGDDRLYGTAGDDVVCGLGGNDTITPANGNDTVYGGHGDDTIDGGNNNDRLFGEAGSDTLFGAYGNDTLNTVDGVAGNDGAHGGPGTDSCSTDTGDSRSGCP
ncbi:calcium-binding protein [Streptomyces lateritius]|uniref:Calcium-binding protein n=1 Tax=Streptomyces lateritius TaxID=67313 RepID=A0ABW6YG19_9ACTN